MLLLPYTYPSVEFITMHASSADDVGITVCDVYEPGQMLVSADRTSWASVRYAEGTDPRLVPYVPQPTRVIPHYQLGFLVSLCLSESQLDTRGLMARLPRLRQLRVVQDEHKGSGWLGPMPSTLTALALTCDAPFLGCTIPQGACTDRVKPPGATTGCDHGEP